MLRILHCYKSYMPDEFGGVAEAISVVASAHDPNLNQSILVARPLGLGRDFVYGGVPVRAVASLGTLSSLPIAPGYPFALAARYRSVDIIVHHSPFPLTDFGLLLGGSAGKPALIVHWHADLETAKITSSWINPLLRRSLRRADRIIVGHESIMRNSPFLQGFLEKCVVIPYGVNLAYWTDLNAKEQAKVVELRSSYPRLIVSTGRLVPYKGHAVLLRALQRVDATLCIIGKGSLEASLRDRVRELRLDHRVIFTGWQERQQLKIMLHAARVFAFPSLTSAESFGIAQLEAMAVGLPVVNTALATAVPHVARHEVEGLTVPPGDIDALASALTRLLDDRELAEQFGRAARQRVVQTFDHENVLELTRQLYEETAAQRASKIRND
jgi:glycosyltransferase involved in cell wall biosynthesis